MTERKIEVIGITEALQLGLHEREVPLGFIITRNSIERLKKQLNSDLNKNKGWLSKDKLALFNKVQQRYCPVYDVV